MHKSGSFGMAWHQAISFNGLMMRIPKAEAVFWPGCALLNLDERILDRTLAVLRRPEPGIRLAAGCCGQPTDCIFPEKLEKRNEALVTRLRNQGVKRIYTACPNCTVQLRQLGEFSVIPIWQTLAQHLTEADVEPAKGKYVWHDPCPTKNDPAQQAAVRRVLAISGCDVTEPAHTGRRTICCGNFRMLQFRDPEKSAVLRARRLAEFPGDRVILTSCVGCVNAFRGEGRDACCLLELLFGPSQSRGWGNRFKTTMKAPIR